MKILFVTNEIPFPPDNGRRIVSHHAMRLMHEAGHELALAVLTEETEDNEKRFLKISSFCNNGMSWWMQLPKRNRLKVQLRALISRQMFFIERYRCPLFRQRLLSLIDEFNPDVIHFDLIPMIQYRDVAPAGVGTVASINDSYSLYLENALEAGNYGFVEWFYRRLQYRQSCRYEARAYVKFDVTHLMARADEDYLHQLNPAIFTAVIPNGVDHSLFEITDQTRGKTDIVFVAKLEGDNLQSLERFIKDGWPIVHQEYPEVKLHIVGKNGPQAKRFRAKTESMDGVVFEGYVDRLTDAYSQCGIAIVPVDKNCGIINKAIEGMAAGLVVVGFKKTFTGIAQAIDGEHFVSAENYSSMGQSVVDIIRDGPRRRAIQKNAHQMATKYYSWHSRIAPYENLYQVFAKNRKM